MKGLFLLFILSQVLNSVILLSISLINTVNKSNLGKKRVFVLCCFQNMLSNPPFREAGQGLKTETGKAGIEASSVEQHWLFAFRPTSPGVALATSIINKKMPNKLAYRPARWMHVFN